jgi:hypothetical protein
VVHDLVEHDVPRYYWYEMKYVFFLSLYMVYWLVRNVF